MKAFQIVLLALLSLHAYAENGKKILTPDINLVHPWKKAEDEKWVSTLSDGYASIARIRIKEGVVWFEVVRKCVKNENLSQVIVWRTFSSIGSLTNCNGEQESVDVKKLEKAFFGEKLPRKVRKKLEKQKQQGPRA